MATAWKFRVPTGAVWRVTDDAQLIEAMRDVWEIVPLVEQRKPLTEDEIKRAAHKSYLMGEGIWNDDTSEDLIEFARAIERAHGIT